MSAVAIASGVYFIENAGSKTVLELPGGSAENRVLITGHARRPLSDALAVSQLWVVSQVGDSNTFTIQNANGRTFMDLSGGHTADGTPIFGFQYNGNPNQLWIITRSTNPDSTAFVIANQASGTFVDLLNGGSANGTAVNGWSGSGPSTVNTHQLWNFVRA